MPANFLHGVETIELDRGPRPVKLVKTAVIGLIGTAAKGPLNTPVLITSDTDAAQFGEDIAGSTIRDALKAVFDHTTPAVIVINVLNPETHKTSVVNEVAVLAADGTVSLAHKAVAAAVVKNSAGLITYVLNTDYSINNDTGKITRIAAGAIAALASLKVSYDWADPSLVTTADLIGTVTGGGVRTGMQALKDCFEMFGFHPKILIAPVFCTQSAIASELAVLAGYCRAIAYVDAPIGITPAQAIAGRGPAGAINFNTSNERLALCYPHVKVFDVAANAEQLHPQSSRRAGLRAKVDQERGYWWSESNQEMLGITGTERLITSRINDPASEANLLNEAGICTLFNAFGSGIRTWGNRSAAWPTVTHPKNFINVRRVADVIAESIEYFTLQMIDRPLDRAWFDALTESVNAFLRKLVGDGAIIDGRCWADAGRNSPVELAAGHAYVSYDFMPPTPAERVTYESAINIAYLKALFERTA